VSERPVIVTGAAGFVGSHVARALVYRGRQVITTDLAPALPERVLWGMTSPAPVYLAGDLADDEVLAALVDAGKGGVDVVHAAAIISFGQLREAIGGAAATMAAAQRSLAVNAGAAWRLCGALAAAGVLGRFLYVSTRSVFGGRPASEGQIGEDAPWQPAGVYGSSKAAAEIGLLALREQFGLDLVIARITGAFGPWQGPASFVGQAIEAVVAGKVHRRDTGGDDAYELTYVKDTVNGLLLLLEADRLAHAIYHVATGERLITLAEVAMAIRAAEPGADVLFGPGRHSGAGGRTPLAIGRAVQEVGFRPRWGLQEAIADYLRVERSGDYGPEAVEGTIPATASEGDGRG
jgi:nucleoside-diphosphate-sugar epimerase